MTLYEQAKEELTHWLQTTHARGSLAVAIQILDKLQHNYNLELETHRTTGKGQLQGIGRENLRRILRKHGESRIFLKEGGRTNRGGQGDLDSLFISLRSLNLHNVASEERNTILNLLEAQIAEKITEILNSKGIKFVFDAKISTWQMIHRLLEEAKKRGKDGSVAQYLVGAKLHVRFSDQIAIENHPASAADVPTNRNGDFHINDAVIHVTVSPGEAVIAKCRDNIANGKRPLLLVPYTKLAAAKQLAADEEDGGIAAEALESFVSQNMEELAVFSAIELATKIYEMLVAYNQIVDEVDTDKSLLIEIPDNLKRLADSESEDE